MWREPEGDQEPPANQNVTAGPRAPHDGGGHLSMLRKRRHGGPLMTERSCLRGRSLALSVLGSLERPPSFNERPCRRSMLVRALLGRRLI